MNEPHQPIPLDTPTAFNCRSCGASTGAVLLDLGVQPLANNLLGGSDLSKVEPRFPLRLAVCRECWLLQILDLAPPVDLFSTYAYFSSFSDTMVRHAKMAAERYIRNFGLNQESLVVEIASNDGYFLQHFLAAGVPCFGIEPAANIASVAKQKGITTLVEFFTQTVALRLADSGKRADLILANNVLAHAPDTNDFIAGLRTLVAPQGRVVIEFPYAIDFIDHGEFDTIYHEHVFYFSLTALLPLFRRHGLEIFRVERLRIHGGSLRVFASVAGTCAIDDSVSVLMAEEKRKLVDTIGYYGGFSHAALETKNQLTTLLMEIKAAGKTIAAYGASAKGSTLLNYAGIGKDLLDFVADRSTYKQGRYMPGTHLPIVPPDQLMARRPDYTLLLTWNFAEEILEQQSAYRKLGGKFIIPIPTVTVV